MSGAVSRLSQLASQILPSDVSKPPSDPEYHIHTLSPTFFLPRAAEIEPSATAVHHITSNSKPLTHTYLSLSQRASNLAYYLKKHSFKRIGILCPNTPAFLEALFGIPGAGGISVAINYRLKPDDIAYIFTHSEVDCIIVDVEFLPLLDPFRKSKPGVKIIEDADTDDLSPTASAYQAAIHEGAEYDAKLGSKGWTALKHHADDENDLFSLAYTSGTTARPKGVEYTHRGVYLASLANIVESGLNPPTGRAKYLWTLPMFHATGWTFPWSVTAVRGTHYCLRKIDYPVIWDLLKTQGITHFCAAPTVNTLLCNAKEAEKLKVPVSVSVAASPPSAFLFEKMVGLNLHPVHVYGLTETYGPISRSYYLPDWDGLPPSERFAKMVRQGHGFITSLPVRVIKTGEDVAEGSITDVAKDGKEIGEIVFVGNICAKGYHKNPEATRKLFAGGVLHSGDLAVWHDDGAIQILDRAKDIIISGGENISSIALESMLAKHPSILEAAVVAVPDDHWGERPKAFVTTQSDSSTTGEEVIQWAKDASDISKFMVPREVEVVKELPKTSTGKIRKNILREWSKGAKRDV